MLRIQVSVLRLCMKISGHENSHVHFNLTPPDDSCALTTAEVQWPVKMPCLTFWVFHRSETMQPVCIRMCFYVLGLSFPLESKLLSSGSVQSFLLYNHTGEVLWSLQENSRHIMALIRAQQTLSVSEFVMNILQSIPQKNETSKIS